MADSYCIGRAFVLNTRGHTHAPVDLYPFWWQYFEARVRLIAFEYTDVIAPRWTSSVRYLKMGLQRPQGH